jgi:hypothetical protein
VAKLRHHSGSDLPDGRLDYYGDTADFIERSRLAVDEPEARPQHTGLRFGKRGKHGLQLVLGVLDEVGARLVVDGLIQRARQVDPYSWGLLYRSVLLARIWCGRGHQRSRRS